MGTVRFVIKFFLLLWVLTLPQFTISAEAPDCNDSAAKLGKQESAKTLSVDCSKFLFDRAPASQIATSAHGRFSAAGYKNAIGISSNHNQDHYDFIAGSNTGLINIQGISIASKQKQVWALDQTAEGKTEIKVFVSMYGGNLKPIRIYDDEKIFGAKFIQVSQSGDETALWYPDLSVVRVFSNVTSKIPDFNHAKISWIREMKVSLADVSKIDSFIWVSDKKKLAFTEKNSNLVAIFDEPDVSGTAIFNKFETTTNSNSPLIRIYWGAKEDSLIATFKDGSTSLLDKGP